MGHDGPSCPTGKRRYRSRIDAMVALSRIQRSAAIERRQREDRRAETRVYECNLCGGWHVSSQRPRRA